MDAPNKAPHADGANSKPSSLSGTRPIRTVRWRAARPMLFAAIAIGGAFLALAVMVISVDPYNIYSWGLEPRIAEGETPRDMVIDWVAVATKDPNYNTFLVGSSVTAMYSPRYLESVLGPDVRAVNLSYGGPRPKDRDMILDRVVTHPNVQHVIITFERTYLVDSDVTNINFPAFLYDSDITNDLRMVNLPAIKTAFRMLAGDVTYTNPDEEIYAKYVEDQYAKFHTPETRLRIAQLVESLRMDIGMQSPRDCENFDAINEQLVPNIRALSERGVKVDIIMPIVSYAYYYVRRNDLGPTLLDETMKGRRCLVTAVDGLANVRVFAFDDDPSIAGDLTNFREVGHVYSPDILDRIITALVTNANRLTRDNVAEYEQTIRSDVEQYDPRPQLTVSESSSATQIGDYFSVHQFQ